MDNLNDDNAKDNGIVFSKDYNLRFHQKDYTRSKKELEREYGAEAAKMIKYINKLNNLYERLTGDIRREFVQAIKETLDNFKPVSDDTKVNN